jgi:hypothetical protein
MTYMPAKDALFKIGYFLTHRQGPLLNRRCELLDAISLLSPAHLFSDERRPFHSGPPDRDLP